MFRSPVGPIRKRQRNTTPNSRESVTLLDFPNYHESCNSFTPDLPKRSRTVEESIDDDSEDELPWMVSASDTEDGDSDTEDEDSADTEDEESDGTEFLSELRSYQWEHGTSEKAMSDLYGMLKDGKVGEHIRKGGKMPDKHTCADKELETEAGVEGKRLHGCPVCNKHIWEEGDKGNVCPRPGCTGKRRNDKGHPFQEVIHYPLKSRLAALLRCKSYKHYADYENWRRQSPDGVVADVYDCEQWKRLFGSADVSTTSTIKLHFCYDGFPLCSYAGCASMTPAEFVVLSLPPWLRYKLNNILISILLPDGMSAEAQKNFFDHVIAVDYNALFTDGFDVDGTHYNVHIFGTTLDLKGREKFLNQVSVQSYCGCSRCRNVFPKGCGGPRFAIARQFLPPGHPLRRRTYGPLLQYPSQERAGAPAIKDTAFVYDAARRALEGGYAHFLGQKGLPLFHSLDYYSYEHMDIADWMHGCGCLYKWIRKTIVGPQGDDHTSAKKLRDVADKTARKQLKTNNVFPDLWEDAPVYLDPRKTSLLRSLSPDAILKEGVKWCRRWWKTCGKTVPKGTRVAALRSQILQWRKYLLDNPTSKLVISTGTKPLPWRLTKNASIEIDERIRSIVYPHGINGCSKGDSSFLRKSGRTWRTAEKLTALLCILPTVLRDYVCDTDISSILDHLIDNSLKRNQRPPHLGSSGARRCPESVFGAAHTRGTMCQLK